MVVKARITKKQRNSNELLVLLQSDIEMCLDCGRRRRQRCRSCDHNFCFPVNVLQGVVDMMPCPRFSAPRLVDKRNTHFFIRCLIRASFSHNLYIGKFEQCLHRCSNAGSRIRRNGRRLRILFLRSATTSVPITWFLMQ